MSVDQRHRRSRSGLILRGRLSSRGARRATLKTAVKTCSKSVSQNSGDELQVDVNAADKTSSPHLRSRILLVRLHLHRTRSLVSQYIDHYAHPATSPTFTTPPAFWIE